MTDVGIIVFYGLLFVTTVAPILTRGIGAITIDNMVVPEVIQSGNKSSASLDCQYTVTDNAQYSVEWLFNHNEVVYQWSTSESQPKISGYLVGRIEFTNRSLIEKGGGALRVLNLVPEMSGEYTCRITNNNGSKIQQTKAMLVFNAEQEFHLEFHKRKNGVEIKCYARGLYPQPELTIERNSESIPKQQQRVWRTEGILYDAECIAWISLSGAKIPPKIETDPDEITCRLQMPQAGYTAMKKQFLYIAESKYNSSGLHTTRPKIGVLLILVLPILVFV